jgi:hypothetical protein
VFGLRSIFFNTPVCVCVCGKLKEGREIGRIEIKRVYVPSVGWVLKETGFQRGGGEKCFDGRKHKEKGIVSGCSLGFLVAASSPGKNRDTSGRANHGGGQFDIYRGREKRFACVCVFQGTLAKKHI